MSTINSNFQIVFVSVVFILCTFFGHAAPPHQHNANYKTASNDGAESLQNYIGNMALTDIELKKLAQFAIVWCHNNALILRPIGKEDRVDIAEFAPISLFPSPFPRDAFDRAMKVQEAMNLLYFRVARDHDFLMNAYKDTIRSDEFIAKLVGIVKEVQEEGIRQPITLMLQRADYLLNVVEDNETKEVKYEPKQVEVNTGAIGGMGLKRRTTELHRRMIEKVGLDASTERVPENRPDAALVDALHMAWELFGDPDAILVKLEAIASPFVYDGRYNDEELAKKSGNRIKVESYSLSDKSERENSTKRLQLDMEDFSLRLDGRRVAVVYSGQSALGCNHIGEAGMEFRRIIERSTAIKVPSLAIAISSSKKVQQMLAMPGALERFFPNPEDAATVADIRATFAGLWGLEHNDEKTQRIIQDAIENPGNYVLKPNKECGGNNFYDEEIAEKLKEFTPTERAAHILMQKLQPMVVKNYLVRPFNEPKLEDVIPELGVYGFLLGNLHDGRVLHNAHQGYHFRTKLSHVNEAGISAGFGYYDTAYLF
uniref:Glutathione synthetase n=1 Tax=Globodera rostochiensis TaxID=31243 RepID=A0A914H518_GLORO